MYKFLIMWSQLYLLNFIAIFCFGPLELQICLLKRKKNKKFLDHFYHLHMQDTKYQTHANVNDIANRAWFLEK